MYLLYGLVSPVVYLAVWVTIANQQGSVSGLTANDFITYYLTLLIVDELTNDITIYILAYKIQDGTLASDLLRPVHPVLTTPWSIILPIRHYLSWCLSRSGLSWFCSFVLISPQ